MDSSLTARKLCETDFVLVASPGYLAAKGAPTGLSDLDMHQCIAFAKGRQRYPWLLKFKRETVSYVPQGSLMTGDAEPIRAAVLCDLGIAHTPFWLLADEIRSGAVKLLLTELQPAPLPIHLVYPAGRRVPIRVKVLIDFLVAAFKRPAY